MATTWVSKYTFSILFIQFPSLYSKLEKPLSTCLIWHPKLRKIIPYLKLEEFSHLILYKKIKRTFGYLISSLYSLYSPLLLLLAYIHFYSHSTYFYSFLLTSTRLYLLLLTYTYFYSSILTSTRTLLTSTRTLFALYLLLLALYLHLLTSTCLYLLLLISTYFYSSLLASTHKTKTTKRPKTLQSPPHFCKLTSAHSCLCCK